MNNIELFKYTILCTWSWTSPKIEWSLFEHKNAGDTPRNILLEHLRWLEPLMPSILALYAACFRVCCFYTAACEAHWTGITHSSQCDTCLGHVTTQASITFTVLYIYIYWPYLYIYIWFCQWKLRKCHWRSTVSIFKLIQSKLDEYIYYIPLFRKLLL